ncbi:E3 ubiquitin-protein ligase LRSAM1-like [Epargyreus clarus]|uniref:E3 ubiquitin-protein ligase LRSAM1-like n=1 Tax=Epargyreus clarus TaxID=520877 RepID=UPI003C2FC937
MGCAVSNVHRATMSLLSRSTQDQRDARIKLDRKLYIAKESPEPDFDLSDCQLRTLPPGIFSICKVYRKENLYLHNNRLQSLEEGGQLSDLYLLKVLNLSCNKFSYLSNNFRYLVNLTELYLQENLLENLPEAIQYLHCLQILDVSKNKLKCLSPSIGSLKCLRKLNITGNKDLTKLCPELCLAANLVYIELDGHRFSFPPDEISSSSTAEIMKFLCNHMNVDYTPPGPDDSPLSPTQDPNVVHNPFMRRNTITWEEQEAAIIEQENKIHKANQEQREKFLSQVLQGQLILDNEIAKVHECKDIERQKLLKDIQDDEKEIESLITNFMRSDRLQPEVVQQQLAHEQAEHDRLLDIARQNYDNVKKSDILKAMESLIEEDYSVQYSQQHYKDHLNNMKQSVLMQESEGSMKLAAFLNAKDVSRTVLVQQLLEDQDVQKAMVSSLLDRVDARSWSLNQEIALISSHLARLSMIEQEKKKMHITFNYNELLDQRVQLVNLLDDLLQQRSKRRKQLIDTLKEAEAEADMKNDFWLKSYQKLIDSAPKNLLNIGKSLDPLLANYLLQEGVIHCLPFLVSFLFSGVALINVTSKDLKESGVSLAADRDGILRAINLYVGTKTDNHNTQVTELNEKQSGPSAPPVEDEQACTGVLSPDDAGNTSEAECVICMDQKSEVVFVPCGHMCCCQNCAYKELECCPMCRGDIERTIKVLVA